MTNTAKVLIGGAAALGAWYLYKLRSVGNLVFFPGSITGMRWEGMTPVMSFQVVVQNSSSMPVSIHSLAGSLYSNGLLVGNVFSVMPKELAGNSQAFVDVEVRFLLLGIVNDIISSFMNRNFVQKVKFEGFANAEGVQIPVDITLSVGID
jgi:LEA14-like dessication related protein